MNKLKHLLNKNLAWAEKIKDQDPEFFHRRAKLQTPEYLWIGCSDSRVHANQIVDLDPGEIFVHRNIANLVVHTDLNCLSVMEFAVNVLKVSHIIVCGHYGCGGVIASLEEHDHDLIDHWLHHIRDVRRLHKNCLSSLSKHEQIDRLCELNVIEQVKNVCNTNIVKNAWASNRELSVHGWIYSLEDGILKDLDTSICSSKELNSMNS